MKKLAYYWYISTSLFIFSCGKENNNSSNSGEEILYLAQVSTLSIAAEYNNGYIDSFDVKLPLEIENDVVINFYLTDNSNLSGNMAIIKVLNDLPIVFSNNNWDEYQTVELNESLNIRNIMYRFENSSNSQLMPLVDDDFLTDFQTSLYSSNSQLFDENQEESGDLLEESEQLVLNISITDEDDNYYYEDNSSYYSALENEIIYNHYDGL